MSPAAVRNMRDPRHLMRYMRYQALTGSDAERFAALAKAEGVKADTIRDSVRQIQMYNRLYDKGRVDLRINESIVKVMPAFEESMIGLLKAEELVEINDAKLGTKRVVKQEDKTTRLEASRIVKDIIIGTQTKPGPVVAINNTQQTAVASLSAAETNEERMDRLRKKAAEHNLLPAEIAGVPTHIDRDDDPDNMDEDDGEDDDEEEEDEE